MPLYYVGPGYCLVKAGQFEESVEQHRRAVELEPDDPLHLNDFGYSLLQARRFNDVEEVLIRRVVSLAIYPPCRRARFKQGEPEVVGGLQAFAACFMMFGVPSRKGATQFPS